MSLVHHKIRVWVLRLGQFSKSRIQTWDLCEPRVSIIGRESHVLILVLEFQYLTCFCLCEINPRFSLFAGFGSIDGADSTVPFNLWKMIIAFIEINRK